MAEPVTTTLGLAALGSFLSHLPEHIAHHVVGGEAHHKFRHLTERVGNRLMVDSGDF